MPLPDLRAEALDSLQTLTVFVAFVTVLFGLRYPVIAAALARSLSGPEKPTARRSEKDDLRRLLWAQCVPLTVLNAVPTYLFLPLSLRIMKHGEFALWGFDSVRTGFVLLTLYLMVFFIWVGYLCVRVASKAYRDSAPTS